MYVGSKGKDQYMAQADSDFIKNFKNYFKAIFSNTLIEMAHMYWHSSTKTVQIYDARKLEASEGLSKRDFFHKHGFVLLKHKSNMTSEDWSESEYKPIEAHQSESKKAKKLFMEGDTPLKRKYNEEIKELLKDILPSAKEFKAPVRGIQRGPGSAYEKIYGSVVHTDFPVDLKSFKNTN